MQVPENHPRRWQPDELRILERLATNGFTPRVIAMRLGRTVSSVQKRLTRHPIPGTSRAIAAGASQPPRK